MQRSSSNRNVLATLLLALVVLGIVCIPNWKDGTKGYGQPAGAPEQPGGSEIRPAAQTRIAPGERTIAGAGPVEGAALRILVSAEDHRPIHDAKLYLMAADGWHYSTATDAHGVASLALREPARILVQHPAYQSLEVQVLADEVTRTITLEGGGAFAGVLRGASFPEEWVVAAVPKSRPRQLLEWTSGGELSRWTSPVSKLGEFELTGLDPTAEYSVIGLADGAYAGVGFQPVVPGPAQNPKWIELNAEELWAAHLVFDGPDGLPARYPPTLNMWESKSLKPRRASAPGFRRAGQLPLAIRIQILGERGFSQSSYPIFFTPDSPSSGEQPMATYTFQLPGYLAIEGQVPLERASSEIVETHVQLTPSVVGWGDVVLHPHGTEYLSGFPGSGVFTAFQLVLEERSGMVLSYHMESPFHESLRLDDIPAGSYAVALRSSGELLRVVVATHDDPLVVVPGESVPLELELADLGSIQLTVFEAGVEQTEGDVGVSVIRGVDPGKGNVEKILLREYPYVVRHLPPGPYYLWLDRPFSAKYLEPSSGQRTPFT